ncbi:head-tail connector protein [Mesorhizobium dulcispinae]|uniref:head-tail connector protein n=1 Tax=Mesorhizobium dulcispinae TaxID=3072316 RepID=UPI002A23F854|nr:head-tail connector protein [Mesorhizobium sp. VK23D]MDX8517967.1 head-tail connector protein [Mesorhizobium sp. VK23D]
MELITLAEFKEHARIVATDEDSAIQLKVDAANAYVSSFLPAPTDPPAAIPDEVRQATLQIASTWWETREDIVPGQIAEVPLDAMEILINHREWSFG